VQVIWEEFLKIIKEEAGSQVVETWFKTVSLEKWDSLNKAIYLLVPNQFVSKWLQEHYSGLIKIHLQRLLNTDSLNLFFTCNNQTIEIKRNIIPASILQEKNQILSTLINKHNTDLSSKFYSGANGTSIVTTKTELPTRQNDLRKQTNLNEHYTFDSFIVGPSNSLAHAAGWAICQNLGKVYNPLYIYGGTGLGKTHLLHAIGNEAKKINPSSIIRYETSDRFTNEFINSIRLDKIQSFRHKYQKIDLLLLDDIQFLSNKEQTQETFFHIFNMLHEQEKQIVLSSDTFPKEIGGLQNRLKSRLEWGLVVDIQMPDLETKIAILKKKAETNAVNLTDDVAHFIASRISSNIRELEGALIRVGAFATLTNHPLSLELAKRVLLQLNENKKEGIMLEKVLRIIAKHYSISITDLKSKKRQKDISIVRQVAFYLMKKLTFCSLQVIGEYIGKRDHSTVLHAISKIENMLDNDKSFAQKLNAIEQEILTS
jgi:chromosomal replication initiator protein